MPPVSTTPLAVSVMAPPLATELGDTASAAMPGVPTGVSGTVKSATTGRCVLAVDRSPSSVWDPSSGPPFWTRLVDRAALPAPSTLPPADEAAVVAERVVRPGDVVETAGREGVGAWRARGPIDWRERSGELVSRPPAFVDQEPVTPSGSTAAPWARRSAPLPRSASGRRRRWCRTSRSRRDRGRGRRPATSPRRRE